jgi:chromosome segregation protein
MRGFKSFGDRKASIPLDKGLIVVTGPNGSGKSNIFDAVRFTLGDLSARSLRADKMSEVIYDGSSSTESNKTAYVSVQLDNTDRRIPVDTETVTIARRVNKEGESDYFLNGKQAARSQLVDMLSMGGLSSNGYNMIVQGTITRLADMTPEERRKAVEELVGIAEYDTKKNDARMQLQQAETNLRVAEARLGDVQARLERLEEERNDALRHNFIQLELRKLRAIQISHKVLLQKGEEKRLDENLSIKSQEAEGARRQREELILAHDEIERRRREFDEEIADKGNVRLVEVQRTIGDIMARMAACRMEIESGSSNLRRLVEMRKERVEQLSNLEKKITESRETLPKLRSERDELKRLLGGKSSIYERVSSKLLEMKQNFGSQTRRLGELEDNLARLNRTINRLENNIRSSETGQRLTSENLKSLYDKTSSYEETLASLQDHLKELFVLGDEGRKDSIELNATFEKKSKRRNNLTDEIGEGEATVRLAREAVVEFEAQRDVAERFLGEEASLQRIEEMVQEGALLGVHGRLDNLISIEPKYRRALDVASTGWLRALVVEDSTIAFRCIEAIKTMRLNPVKIIPLANLKETDNMEPPDIEGIAGTASNYVRCRREFEPAVRFVFGDTLVSTSEKSAFIASREGWRVVDIKGDLYEARGGIVAGFYRTPIELSSLVPGRKIINGLSQSVLALDKLVERRKQDQNDLENELTKLTEERARREQLTTSIDGDVRSVQRNIDNITENAKILEERVRKLENDLHREEQNQIKFRNELEVEREQLVKVARERRDLRLQNKPEELGKYEVDQTQLNTEISGLHIRFTKIETEIDNIDSLLQTRFQPDYESSKSGMRSIDNQFSSLEKEVSVAQETLKELDLRLSELNRSKEELSLSLKSVNDRRRGFELELDRIDTQRRRLEQLYEPLSSDVHHLELEAQTRRAEINHLGEELRNLGYEGLIEASAEGVEEAEKTMDIIGLELETLGSVNQLAITQYIEQQEKYKQLSVRRNQLELEKKAIIDFMDEIEQKKKNAFMQAFNSINQSFTRFFERLTGSGVGILRLQNPDEPFSAGVDIFVQFPGKGMRLIAGASGGEKSVTAVAFVFAIQNLSPAPFYIFDEIDAHLDPFNTERLADALKEQAVYSQLVVITLRDVVMDRADRLFGVYIQDGVSRVISTKIAEATTTVG